MTDPHDILIEVLATYQDAKKWNNQPFENIKRISNTKVGDAGMDFVERYVRELGYTCERSASKQSPWDMKINEVTFEVKTASEDVSGCFQFNHIRYHRKYEALLCVGVSPASIYVGAWSKADVATNKAGTLVSMEKGANASHKLTKRPAELFSAGDLKEPLDGVLKTIR